MTNRLLERNYESRRKRLHDELRTELAMRQWSETFPIICREQFSHLDEAGIVGEQRARMKETW